MRVSDIFINSHSNIEKTLNEQCSVFLRESNGIPLTKLLPSKYQDFDKIKVRKRKRTSKINKPFNEAFNSKYLRERAVFANSNEDKKSNQDKFYLFPIDGYKFLYSTEVTNSTDDYKKTFNVLYENFGFDAGNKIITDLLKFSYSSTNLSEGLEHGAEIILYNIPYFYTVRTNIIDDYGDFFSNIRGT